MNGSGIERRVQGIVNILLRKPNDPQAFRARIEAGFRKLAEGSVRTEKPLPVSFASRDETPRPNDGTSLGEALGYLMPGGVREAKNGS